MKKPKNFVKKQLGQKFRNTQFLKEKIEYYEKKKKKFGLSYSNNTS
jgi:hypothetical protein